MERKYQKLEYCEFKKYFKLLGARYEERKSDKYQLDRDFYATISCKTERAITILQGYLISMGMTVFKARRSLSAFKKRKDGIEFDLLTQEYSITFQPYCENKLFTFHDFLERVKFDMQEVMTKTYDQITLSLSCENDQVVGNYIFKGGDYFGSVFVQTTLQNQCQLEHSNYILNNLGEIEFNSVEKLNLMIVLCDNEVAPSIQLKKISKNILLSAVNLKSA